MLIDFNNIPEKDHLQFKGGDNTVKISAFDDGNKKIMKLRLVPGSSIGEHSHTDNCEIIYCLEGYGEAICDNKVERLAKGQAHYCPKGCTHTLRNIGNDDLVIFAVVG